MVPRPLGRSGSFLLLVVGILFLLSTVGFFFGRHMVAWRSQARRQAIRLLGEAFSRGFAQLAREEIQYHLLRREGGLSDLRRHLSQPLPIGDFAQTLDLGERSSSFAGLVSHLRRPLDAQAVFTFTAVLSATGQDFQGCGLAGLPREKRGCLRLRVTTRLANQEDEFRFLLPVKVTAAVVPVVSKFTLFLQDGETNADPRRFNLVSNGLDGSVLPDSRAWPMVFCNGPEFGQSGLTAPEIRWGNFFARPVGLVYIGGSPADLNLAMGLLPGAGDGEAFQIFKSGRPIFAGGKLRVAPLLTWHDEPYSGPGADGGNIQLDRWDLGVANIGFDAPRHPPLIRQIGELFRHRDRQPDAGPMWRNSSVFRLLGTEDAPSPTLVFGPVSRGILRLSAFRLTANPSKQGVFRYPLIDPPDLTDWFRLWDPLASSPTGEVATALEFLLRGKGHPPEAMETVLRYVRELASDLQVFPYNQALGVMAGNLQIPDPLALLRNDPLAGMIAPTTSADRQRGRGLPAKSVELPAELRSLIPGPSFSPTDFGRLGQYLDGMAVPGDRTAWHIRLQPGENLLEALKRRNLLFERNGDLLLDLNGWLVVDPPTGEEHPRFELPALRVVSPGGILFRKGSVALNGRIIAATSPFGKSGVPTPEPFTLATREGDISVHGAGPIDAALITGLGKVRFSRPLPPTKEPLIINGALAMTWYDLENASRPVRLQYNPRLGVNPALALPEEPALAFSVFPQPVPAP